MVNPRNKPKFVRWPSKSLRRLKPSWRRPRGHGSKVKLRKKGKQKMPSISYGAPKKVRYLHPSGFKEVLIHNVKDLERINAEKEAGRVASAVSKRKKSEILKKAEELKVKILNP